MASRRTQGRSNNIASRRDAAESMAIAALGFLAGDPEHLDRFLAITGIGAEQLREAAREPGFLAGVLEHFASDEQLLIAFAQEQQIDPAEFERARAALGGGTWERDVP